VAFLAFQQAYLLTEDIAGQTLTHMLNASVGAGVINILDPSAEAVAIDSKIVAKQTAIEVKKGCEGFEVIFILFAALVAYPAAIRYRLAGILIAIPVVYIINLARIVSLFLVLGHAPRYFDFAHLYVWQTLIIAAAAGYFLLWLQWKDRFSRETTR
jgi:exosortase family protein XrtM